MQGGAPHREAGGCHSCTKRTSNSGFQFKFFSLILLPLFQTSLMPLLPSRLVSLVAVHTSKRTRVQVELPCS